MVEKSISIAHILEKKGVLTARQANILLSSKEYNSIVRCLTENTVMTEDEIIELITNYYNIPYINLDTTSIDIKLTTYIPYSHAKKYNVLPLYQEGNTLYIVMEDPLNMDAIEDIKAISGMDIQPYICHGAKIQRMVNLLYADLNVRDVISDYSRSLNTRSVNHGIKEISSSDYDVEQSPVVKFLDATLVRAIGDNASDIHIEPFHNSCRIRYRVDGQLDTIMTIRKDLYTALVARVKVLGKLDIAETRQPQDGRLMTTIDSEEIDIRISILPTLHGEKIVLRLLNRSTYLLTKENLGLGPSQIQDLQTLIHNPNGIILVTGPAGSGKTTTLYAILHELNTKSKNITTIEDPVEYNIQGINQIQVNSKIGFANGLRATLRQDPDVIMVGEIRDRETADMAIRSATTGHLVLSTLHTKNGVGAITRLLDMGVEHFLLASTMAGVISQRLIRVLCPSCKVLKPMTSQEGRILDEVYGGSGHGIRQLYSPVGCDLCNLTGYKGRTGVFEVLLVTDPIRYAISQQFTEERIVELAHASNMEFMKVQCLSLLSNGITDIGEILKVVYTNDLMRSIGGLIDALL